MHRLHHQQKVYPTESDKRQKTARPIPVYNADGTLNKSGSVTEYAELRVQIQDHSERMYFAVSDLGDTDCFIGHEWLKQHNPDIDWQRSKLTFSRCPESCGYTPENLNLHKVAEEEDEEQGLAQIGRA